jgi:cerevisin
MKYILAAILLPLAFASPTSPLAPLSKRGETIDDSYIVVFKKDVNPQQMALHLAGLEEWHQADVSFVPSLIVRLCGESIGHGLE